jgi:hypothetical protein
VKRPVSEAGYGLARRTYWRVTQRMSANDAGLKLRPIARDASARVDLGFARSVNGSKGGKD